MTETTERTLAAVPPRSHSGWSRTAWQKTRPWRPILLLLMLLVVVFGITQSSFLTFRNLQNAVTSVADLWIVAMGMTLVLISGGFDLSVGAVAALSGYLMADLLSSAVPGAAALVLAVLLGAAIGGIINGVLIGWLRLNVFVVTLASMTTIGGVLFLWSGTQSIYVSASLGPMLSSDALLGVQVPVWIMAVTFVVALYVQTKTWFGRDIYAVGGSPLAAQLSGIRTTRTFIAVYAIAGACAALAGAIDVAQAGAATPQVSGTLPLQAIAAVLLGGTLLTGGAGGVAGTALGVLFIGILQNGLALANIPSYWQQVVTGVILVVAVLGGRQLRGYGRARLRFRLSRRRQPATD